MTDGAVVLAATGAEMAVAALAVVVVAVIAGTVATAVAGRAARARALDVAKRSGIEVTVPPEGFSGALSMVERGIADQRTLTRQTQATCQLLRDALDGLPQGVVVVDGRGEVVERNAAAAAFVDARHADALIEAAVAELVDGALGGLADQRVLELFGPPWRVVVVEVAPIVTAEGNAVVVVIDDVTERRRLEAVRKDFVANISHELKTPIGAIGLLAETLLGEDDPTVSERLAGRIQDEALRVGDTIEDLLELSRIETATMAPTDSVVVHDVVGEAVRRIHPAAEQAGIAIDWDDVDDGVEIRGDRRQLTSAISNLLDNAVKYSDGGSTVTISAHLGPDAKVTLSVADDGIGIPARDLERVFERFYRVDQGRGRDTGGTGLGLAIVRHVAANHDGSVEVESRLGVGSVFTLRLPAHPLTEAFPRSPQELAR